MDRSHQASGGYSHLSEFDFDQLNSTAPGQTNVSNFTSEELHAIFDEAKLTPEQLERFRKTKNRILRERHRDNAYDGLRQTMQQNSMILTEGLRHIKIQSNPKPTTTSKSNPSQNSVKNSHAPIGNEAAFLETAACSMNLMGNTDQASGDFVDIHSPSKFKMNDVNDALEEAKLTPEQSKRLKKVKLRELRELKRDLDYQMLVQEAKQDTTRCLEDWRRLRKQSSLNEELFNPPLATQQHSVDSADPQIRNVTTAAAVTTSTTVDENSTATTSPCELRLNKPLKGTNLMIIKVIGIGQNAIYLPICPDTTIFRIKELLIKKIGVEPTHQVLYTDSAILPNDSTAEECGLTDLTEVGLVVEM